MKFRRVAHILGALSVVLSLMAAGSARVRAICAIEAVVRQGGNSSSGNAALSADGRYMAFDSNASNLLAGDTNGVPDVFVYDRLACTVDRVSLTTSATEANGASIEPSISDDGNIVAFASLATNLITGVPDNDGNYDIYVRNRTAATTSRVSVSSLAVQGNSHSHFPAVSGDGSVIAFVSQASNLVTGDTNGKADVFAYAGGTTTRVSVATGGAQGTSAFSGVNSYHPSVSTDGRFVAFASDMGDLVAGDTNNGQDVFLHDRQTTTTTRMSIATAGTPGDAASLHPSVSGDGRYVAFEADAGNLVAGDTNGRTDIFLRDTVAATTTRLSVTSLGAQLDASSSLPSISSDGRYVAFLSGSNALAAGDTNNPADDIVVLDRQTNITRLVSTSVNGAQANNASLYPDISADGQFVAFESAATTLVTPDTNGFYDVFNVNWPAIAAPPHVNLARNGDFSTGTLANWLTFATPDDSYLVSNVTGGVLQYYRVAPPPGTANQAVVFQQTTAQLPAGAPVVLQAGIGNSDNVRKRISLLVHNSDFSDLSVCTFWLPASTAIQTYIMYTHTTQAWSNLTISFYAASAGSNNGGFYRLDNVSVQYEPAGASDATVCVDATAPTAPGGAEGPDLLVNGDFGTGALSPWSLFGTITQQIAANVFEFIKPSSTEPSGVVFQATGLAMTANQILTATFDLGNSSAVRKRVTVLLHDNDFSDLSACTFWLAPNQPLSTYAYRTFATRAWTNATLSVYPATVGAEQWIRLDNVTLRRTPGNSIVGAECLEPGAVPPMAEAGGAGAVMAPAFLGGMTRGPASKGSMPALNRGVGASRSDAANGGAWIDGWIANGFSPTGESSPFSGDPSWIAVATGTATHTLTRVAPLDLTTVGGATLQFESWLSGTSSRAQVQVSLDGVTWETVRVVGAFDRWMPVRIDLSAFAGEVIDVRFVLDAQPPAAGGTPDVWRLGDIRGDASQR